MRTFSLTLCAFLLAVSAVPAPAQMTRVQRIRGNDQRGKYDIGWVRLTERFPNAAVRARINADLEREARSHLCEPDPERSRVMDSTFEMEVSYLSPRLLGVWTMEDSFCGGAHPNNIQGGLLYDLRTGARLTLENELADPRAFHRFVARRALAAKPRDAEDCGDEYTFERLSDTEFIYIPRRRALGAIQNYPHIILACVYETPIPYADVVRFLKPASPLRALAPRR